MTKVENGNNVKIHYKGTLDDGTVFDDSRGRAEALSLELGAGKLLPAFEEQVLGMAQGEIKTFKIEKEQAYGDILQEAIREVPKSSFPDGFNFTPGSPVVGENAEGDRLMGTIVASDEDIVTLDHNHPLAGKDLTFEVEMLEIL